MNFITSFDASTSIKIFINFLIISEVNVCQFSMQHGSKAERQEATVSLVWISAHTFILSSQRHECIDFLSNKKGIVRLKAREHKAWRLQKATAQKGLAVSVRLRAPLALFHYETKRTCVADVWGSFFKCIITGPPPPRSTSPLPPLNIPRRSHWPLFVVADGISSVFDLLLSYFDIHLLLEFSS